MILDELLSQYENARSGGQELTPEELCRDHPELLDQVRKHTRALRNITTPVESQSSPTIVVPPTRASTESNYAVVRPYARGGLGEVLLAHDERLGRDVALKVIRGGSATVAERRERFVREAEITSRLEHPGVIPVYGLGTDNEGRPCYAMRIVRGDTLAIAIEKFHGTKAPLTRSNLGFRDLLSRFIQVCNTIAYAHSQQILHRDLKPSNILLGDFGETVVIDWGLAKFTTDLDVDTDSKTHASTYKGDSETQTGAVLGTPAFMSPEQATGTTVTSATDVFALGGILYAILTSQPPYSGISAGEMNQRIQSVDIAPPRSRRADVPVALQAVCLKAMSRNPADRYADAKLLAADVDRWLADSPVSVGRDPWAERTRRWVQNHRTFVAVSAASLFVAIIGLAIATTILGTKNEQLRLTLQRAETGEKSAHENFDLARDAVDRFATRVGEDPRLKLKDAERLRKDLLAMAVQFNQRLAERDANNPALAVEVARAHLRLGHLAYQMGDPSAEQQIRNAIHRLESLPPGTRSESDQITDLGKAWFAIGLIQQMNAKRDDALVSLEKCRGYRTRLVELDPKSVERISELADIDQLVSQISFAKGNPLEAIAALEKAIALLKQNQQSQPDAVTAWRNLPRAMNVLAMFLHMTRQFDKAEAKWKQAAATIPAKLADDDDGLGLRLRLAEIHRNLGNFYRERNNFAAAGESYQLCLQSTTHLMNTHPAMVSYRAMHASGLFGLGTVQWEHNENAAAETSMKAALPIYLRLYEEQPTFADNRSGLIGVEVYLAKLDLKNNCPADAATRLRSGHSRLAPMPADIMPRQFLSSEWMAVAKADPNLSAEGFDAAVKLAGELASTPRTSRDAIVILRQLASAGAFQDKSRRDRLDSKEFAPLANDSAIAELKTGIPPSDS